MQEAEAACFTCRLGWEEKTGKVRGRTVVCEPPVKWIQGRGATERLWGEDTAPSCADLEWQGACHGRNKKKAVIFFLGIGLFSLHFQRGKLPLVSQARNWRTPGKRKSRLSSLIPQQWWEEAVAVSKVTVRSVGGLFPVAPAGFIPGVCVSLHISLVQVLVSLLKRGRECLS